MKQTWNYLLTKTLHNETSRHLMECDELTFGSMACRDETTAQSMCEEELAITCSTLWFDNRVHNSNHMRLWI